MHSSVVTTMFRINLELLLEYTATWKDFLGDSKNLEDVKEYVYLRVKVVFDPPASASVLASFNERIKDLEWLLNEKVD